MDPELMSAELGLLIGGELLANPDNAWLLHHVVLSRTCMRVIDDTIRDWVPGFGLIQCPSKQVVVF